MATLSQNIERTIDDLDSIRGAIESKGVEVPEGTNTDQYGSLIESIGGSSYEEVIAFHDDTTHTLNFDDGNITIRYTGSYEVIVNNTDKVARHTLAGYFYTFPPGGNDNRQRPSGTQSIIEVIDDDGKVVHSITTVFENWLSPIQTRILKFF